MRLSVGALKGGVAKTTTSVHLALGLSRTGRVLLVDADPDQPGTVKWQRKAGADWPEAVTVLHVASRDLTRVLEPRLPEFDHLVIDVGPKNPILLRQALALTDHLLIPIQPTSMDVDEVKPTIAVAVEVDKHHPVTAAVLFANLDSRWKLDERDARQMLEKAQIPVMDSVVRHLRSFAMASGSVPLDDLNDYEDVLAELYEEEAQ